MPKRKIRTRETRALLKELVPNKRIGRITIETVTPTNKPALDCSLTVQARCDCGRPKNGYAREYLDALRLNRNLACRSCFARESKGRQWPGKEEPHGLVRRVAKRLFLDHARACKRQGVYDEIATSWRQFGADALDELVEEAKRTMQLKTKKQLCESIAAAWYEQYYRPDWESANTYKIYLMLRDLKNAGTEDEIAAIIGDRGWTENKCGECGKDSGTLVHFGAPPDMDVSYFFVCPECLRNALKLIP